MRFRYTENQILNKSDKWFILRLIFERKSDCTNIYSSLYRRLTELENKIINKKKLTDNLVLGQHFEVKG